ncbi:hypothetical protein DL546_002601 [Coniochaeta pulveracea]|uniref:2EXR domain-containing protein n=1 Tax=Coniochaeta pulveracea TaxID=177199 RepID=A0A420Y5J3_9PEZI|nr:hypothetical protein DL546_002601 [Coniochaeta pulveracea]
MAFPQFRRLPTEIRREIWRQCLPNRVVELDEPVGQLTALFPDDADYCCFSNHTAHINRQPPLISRVCVESRTVALEHVDLSPPATRTTLDFAFGTSMGPADWVDKRRDVLHLNYNDCYSAWYREGEGVFDLLVSEAEAKAQGASLTWAFYDNVTDVDEYLDTLRNRRLLVSLGVVTIHAPLQPALESGLFGLLGDARVVLVDANDTERLKQYQSFCEKHGLPPDTDPHPASFFNKYCQQGSRARVQDRTEDMRFSWLVNSWFLNKDRIDDPEGAWSGTPETIPERPEEQWWWQRWVPNREHPWMKDMLEAMPRIQPRIMVRLCTQRCPIEYPSARRARK